MNLLYITKRTPYPIDFDGTTRTSFPILSGLPAAYSVDMVSMDSREFDVIQAFKEAGVRINSFHRIKANGALIKFVNLVSVFLFGKIPIKNRALYSVIKDLMRNTRYNIIYAEPEEILVEMPHVDVPIFLNAHDSLSNLNRSFYAAEKTLKNRIKIMLYQAYEKNALKQAACVNFVSGEDAAYVRDLTGHKNVVNITIGIDRNEFYRDNRIAKVAGSVLFTGNFLYKPNAGAGKYIVEDVFPLLCKERHAVLYIVGKNPPAFKTKDERVIVTGFVESIAEWYNKAEIFFCPLLYGAGIKNKILEALACGLPLIATSVAVSGIAGLIDRKHFILAETKEAQVRAIEELLDAAALRRHLSENAVNFIEQNYDIRKSVAAYYAEFEKLTRKWRER